MSVILVPVADRPECAYALEMAFDFGKKLGASIVGCHILAHSDSNNRLSSRFGAEYVMPGSIESESALLNRANPESSYVAKELFTKVAESKGYSVRKRLSGSPAAIWNERLGSPDKVMRIIGPVNDLIVVSRPVGKGSDIARLFMMTAIMESGRPVLVLPQTGIATIGQRIMIAWNQSVEVMHAVTSSLTLLKASDEVNIVTCGPENRIGPKAGQLGAYLRSWRVNSTIHKTPGKNVEKELINAYRRTHSDLLLMGAYSKRRWQQIIFGGTSQFMLEKAAIPVLMSHT